MLGNFTYCNPTKLIFGKGALDGLKAELEKFGKNTAAARSSATASTTK